MANYNSDTDKELEAVLGSHKTEIRIVGAGGAGNNTVTRLLEVGIKDVEVIAVNTDAQDLLYAKADKKVLIGKTITNGLGAGSDPSKGRDSAKENLIELEESLQGSDMVFITCGLGGGTGTGSAPIIAEIAKKTGALAIAVVTLPFSDEGVVRLENARKGLEELQANVDTVIVVQNDKLLDLVPDMPLNQAFKVADEILVNTVKGITELVTEKGLVNLDFADVRTIMQNGGLAMIGFGESEEMNAEEAAEHALQNPLLDVEITGARSALINISGGQELSLKAAKTIMKIVAQKLDPSAKIIWGARLNDELGKKLSVMLIVTCLQSHKKSASEIDMVLKKTEVKNISVTTNTNAAKIIPKEVVTVTKEPEKVSETKEEPGTKKSGSVVFTEIFLEESSSDLELLEEAISYLKKGSKDNNKNHLHDIKSACSSLISSAELFGYTKISKFVELINEITASALKDEFDFSENLIELYKEVPSVLNGLMVDKADAFERAEDIKQKFRKVKELLTGDELKNDSDTEKKAESEKSDLPDEKSSDDKGNFSNVRDAVKYIDKLF